ncbi:hypothetical protein [Aquimarina longa]|uniref:hypothetical protein n=1 Tax=Aquimarina longa TaxID=1080221 RepID=UPI000781055D|nr:hypothetical protein [Aquimarina longa]
MNYATQHHTGYNSVTQQTSATAISPTFRGIFSLSETSKRPSENSKRQATSCTDISIANGFLRTQFSPKMQVSEEITKQSKKVQTQTEKDFYKSLIQLADYYKVRPMKTQHLEYPYNIRLAYWDIKRKLKETLNDNNEVHIIQTAENQTVLSVSETYDTDSYLYYVPIHSLFKMLNNKEYKQTKILLFSVFSYLYRNIGIPFYREEDAYLFWLYDMTKDWIIEGEMYDGDEEHKTQTLKEIAQCEYIGDTILKKIQSQENLHHWQQRLQSFCVKNEFDNKLFSIAEQFYQLWQDYPNECVFRYANPQNEYNDECLTMDKYLSFTCSFEGVLQDQINEILNNDLSVYSEMQEPTLHKIFNGKEIPNQNFDFEHRFFNLLDKLICLLA